MKRVNYYYAAPQFLLLPEALRAEEDSKRRKLMTAALAVAFALETLVAVGIYNKMVCFLIVCWNDDSGLIGRPKHDII